MKSLYILIKELGNIELVSVTDSLAELLWRDEFKLDPVDSRDMRVRNLPFSYDVYEASLESYRKLVDLSVNYEKMDKAIGYYQSRYSTQLVNHVVGDLEGIFQNLGNADNGFSDQAIIDIDSVPNLILQRLKQYFVDSFLIKDVAMSSDKHANIKYIDDTAEFRIVFTVLDVAMPNDNGIYEKMPVQFEVFGRYQERFYFDFKQIKTNKDRYFGYDEQLYEKRQAYIDLIVSRCRDKSGDSLEQCLEKVANDFIHGFDFYLE